MWFFSMYRSPNIFLAVLFCFTALFESSPAYACSCSWGGPFLEVTTRSSAILLGKVDSHKDNSLIFEVLEVLRGKEERKFVRIWGDNGALCRPYVMHFPVGSEWVFALSNVSPQQGLEGWYSTGEKTPSGAKSDYEISICGEFSLRVKGTSVHGESSLSRSATPVTNMELNELRRRLRGIR